MAIEHKSPPVVDFDQSAPLAMSALGQKPTFPEEAQFSLSVLAKPYELGLDLCGFLRGDPKTRRDTYNIARERSTLTVDEIRQAEGYGPKPKQEEPAPISWSSEGSIEATRTLCS